MVNTPENGQPSQNTESFVEKMKRKVGELVTAVKEKVDPAKQKTAEDYLTEENQETKKNEHEQFSRKKKSELQELKNSIAVAPPDRNATEVVNTVKKATENIVQEASQPGEHFFAFMSAGSAQVAEATALPFARFVCQVGEYNGFVTRYASDEIKKWKLFKEIFIDEAQIDSATAKPFVELLIQDLLAHAAVMAGANRDDLREFDVILNILKKKNYLTDTEVEEMSEVIKMSNPEMGDQGEREGDEEMRNFIKLYGEFEIAVKKHYGPNVTEARRVLYDYLELDIQKVFDMGKKDKPSTWGSILADYEHMMAKPGHKLPPELQEIWLRYFNSFKETVEVKQASARSWDLYGGGKKGKSIFGAYGRQQYNLSDYFNQNEYDKSLLSFMFIESHERDAWDIFSRFMYKSHLEHGVQEHDKDKYNKTMKNLVQDGEHRVDYGDFEAKILSGIKRLYINEASYNIKGSSLPQGYQQIMSRMQEVVRAKRFTTSGFTFLGGKIKEGNASVIRVSSASTREQITSAVTERGAMYYRLEGTDPSSQTMADLMEVFDSRLKSLVDLVRRSTEFKKNLRLGKTDDVAGIARDVTNAVLSMLTSESDIIIASMTRRINSFRLAAAMADGQMRTSFFFPDESSGATPQDLEMYRALQALYNEEGIEENYAAVYGALAEMLMWGGIGDIMPQLARYLPPVNMKVDKLPEVLAKMEEAWKIKREEIVKTEDYLNKGKEENGKVKQEIFLCQKQTEFYSKFKRDPTNIRRKIDSTYFDEPFRALFQKINPVFFGLWADQGLGQKVQHLLFAGAYGVDDDKKPEKGIEKLMYQLWERFHWTLSKEFDTDPLEILANHETEKATFIDGMDDTILEQRQKGKWGMVHRFMQFFPFLGFAERGSWRDEAIQLQVVLSKYEKYLAKTNNESAIYNQTHEDKKPILSFNPYDLIDMCFQIGPRTAQLMADKMVLAAKTDPLFDNLYKSYLKQKYGKDFKDTDERVTGEKKDIKEYVMFMMYEMYPSLFTMRPDIRRFTHQKDDTFMEVWRTRIMTHLYTSNLGNDQTDGFMKHFLPQGVDKLEVYTTAMGDLSKSLQENEVKARIIQQNLLEGELLLENHVMAERNRISEYGFKIDRAIQGDHVTLRKTLTELQNFLKTEKHTIIQPDNPEKRMESVFRDRTGVDPGALRAGKMLYTLFMKQAEQHGLSITNKNVLSVMHDYVSHLKDIYYGDNGDNKDDGEGFRRIKKDVGRGIVGNLEYYDIGADTEEKRRQKTSLFGLLDGVVGKYTGPLVDFTYEFLGMKDPDTYNPLVTGGPDSGKSISIRMYGDFETYVKESGQWSEAIAVINKAILATDPKELETLENDYLGKVSALCETLVSYTSEDKRYTVGWHMIKIWLLVARAPQNIGAQYDFGGELAHLTHVGKSYAELVNPDAQHIQSAFRYTQVKADNFIIKACNKNILPRSNAGTDVSVGPKTIKDLSKGTFLEGSFKAIDTQLENLNKKAEGLPPGEKLNFIERTQKGMLEIAKTFGLNQMGLFPTYEEGKYRFNANLMRKTEGLNRYQNFMQFAWYALIFASVVTFLAIQQGFGELEKTGGKA